jgi:hypothetical protein
METQKHYVLYIGIAFLILITIGAYFYFIYKKTHSGITLQCSALKLTLSPEFTALPHPADLSALDEFGCVQGEDGCACAKVTPSGQGIVFGVSKAEESSLKIPPTVEEQKTFLASLGMFVRANSATGTLVTSELGTYKDLQSVTVKSLNKDEQGKTIEARNIFFVYNNNLLNINFQTEQELFATYWAGFEQSLNNAQLK